MSIRTNTTTGSTGYQKNNTDTLARVVHELREVKRAIEELTSGGSGAGLATEVTLQQVESNTDGLEGLVTASNGLLTSIDGNLTSLDKNSGASTGNTLRVVLEDLTRNGINQMQNDTSIVKNATSYAVWDMFPGNSKVINWVAGSVQPFVVDTIEYYIGPTLVITQTFTYDANDNVTSITAS